MREEKSLIDYRLDGACQDGIRKWSWFGGKEAVKIEHGDVLHPIEHKNYTFYELFPRTRKWLMNLLGYVFCYSKEQHRYVIVHKSILERYFTKINSD